MALITDGLTIPPAGSLNGTGKGAAERQLQAAAARSVLPLVYGTDRIGGLVANVLAKAGTPGRLLVQVLWCWGCDNIDELRLGDAALPGTITVTHYTGSQTVADATLVAAFAAQGISGVLPLTGTAWSLIDMPSALFDGQLAFTARIRGRRCYDPAFDSAAGGTGPQRLADPATWTYSECPAVCLADFLYNATYGCGQAVSWPSVITTGGANRAIVSGSSEQRRLVGVSFVAPASTKDVAETLRAYAGCFLLPTAAGIKLLPDANDAPSAIYQHSAGQIASIGALEQRDLSQAPTAVEVIYTDTSAIPWRDASATAQIDGAGVTKPWRLSQVRLPGIHRHSQALREATERLNKLQLNNLSTVLEVFDDGIRLEEGDIIQVDHPIGLDMALMRVGKPSMTSLGRWELPLVQHSPAAYSDSVVTVAPVVDPGRDLPPAPPLDVADLVGSITKGIIRWSWTPATERDYAETRLRLGGADWDAGTPMWSGRGSEVLQPVTTTGVYTVRARHALRDGQESLGVSVATVTVNATDLDDTVPDLTPPPTPTGVVVTTGFAMLLVQHDTPTYAEGHGHATTRVYGVYYAGGAEPTIGSAIQLAEFSGNIGRVPLELGITGRVWVKWVSKDGVESEVAAGGSGTNGIAVTTGLIGGANLAPLAVTAAKLAADAVDLGSDKVTGTITDPARFGALAVGYTVTQYLLATEGVLGNLVVDNAQIGSLSVAKLLGGALDVSAYIRSPGYAPGVQGWNIDADGTARFRNLIVDGDSYFDGQVTMRRPDGSVMFASGYTLNWADITPASGWLNANQQWAEVNGRPKSYRVGAYGLSATGVPADAALVDADTNTILVGAGPMYRVAKIHRLTKVVTNLGNYNPLVNGATDCSAMADVLNSIDSEHVCVVYSYDEPQSNRLLGGLPAAMYRNGASRAVFGSAAFRYRGAYILVGIGGCGEGNGAECYAGAVDFDTNAWCDTTFQITALGALVVNGATRGATTLLDLDYVGDRNASATVKLINDGGGLEIAGSTITKTGGSPGWTAGWHSQDSYTGGAYVSFVLATGDKDLGVGLNTSADVSDPGYNTIDHWLHYDGAGNLGGFESGNPFGGIGPAAVGDVLAIAYDGVNVRYLRNGTVIATRAHTITAPLFADGSFSAVGGKITNVQFGPLSSNDWAATGGAGKPEDNATVGAAWGSNLTGRPSNLSGLSGSETIRNDQITISAGGVLGGIGTGGVVVSNAQMSIGADGKLYSAGVFLGTSATLSGMGAGAMALINQITNANVSTYIAGAAIELAQIKVASINTLAALSSFLGTVEIAAGGYLRSGKTSFADTTAGFWLANAGGVPEFFVGNSSAWIKFSPTYGFELRLDTFTVTLSHTLVGYNQLGVPFGYTSPTITTTVSGGQAPYSYQWTLTPAYTTGTSSVYLGSATSSSAQVSGEVKEIGGQASAYYTVTVTDSNGRSASATGFFIMIEET